MADRLQERFLELKQISAMRQLTRSERQEFIAVEQIINNAQAETESRIANDPAHQERVRQHVERQWHKLFSTVINLDGKQWTAVDNIANRAEIRSWFHPGEVIQDSGAWLIQVLKDTPSLASKIGWDRYLTPAEKTKQDQEQQTALRQQFAHACRNYGIAPTEANFQVWSSVPNPVISYFDGTNTPCVVLPNGDTMELTAVTQEQKQAWVEEAQTKQLNQKQADLRRMRDSNDIVGLKKMMSQERTETSRNVYQLYRDLQTLQGFAERQEYLLPALPANVTAATIMQGDREKVGKLGRMYGFARLTAVLHGQNESFFTNYDQKIKELQLQLGEKHTAH